MILSKQAGSYEELKDHVISVDPYDIDGTSKAIYNAINMNETNKNQNSIGLKNIIKNHTITDWLSEQIIDINNKF